MEHVTQLWRKKEDKYVFANLFMNCEINYGVYKEILSLVNLIASINYSFRTKTTFVALGNEI